jgi:hypothetical protein
LSMFSIFDYINGLAGGFEHLRGVG